jgi:hypothetical protein
VEKGGLSYARGTDDGNPLPSRKIEIHSLEDLHTFGSVSVRLEKLLDLNQFFQTIASLAF